MPSPWEKCNWWQSCRHSLSCILKGKKNKTPHVSQRENKLATRRKRLPGLTSFQFLLWPVIAQQEWLGKWCSSSELFRAERRGGKWPGCLGNTRRVVVLRCTEAGSVHVQPVLFTAAATGGKGGGAAQLRSGWRIFSLWCKSKAGWIYERPSEIVSVREVKLPIILCTITADDRRSLGQSGSMGFMAFSLSFSSWLTFCAAATSPWKMQLLLFHFSNQMNKSYKVWMKRGGNQLKTFQNLSNVLATGSGHHCLYTLTMCQQYRGNCGSGVRVGCPITEGLTV